MTEQHCSRKKSSSRPSFTPAIKLIPCHMDYVTYVKTHLYSLIL
jgi:hypothetical protein